MMSRPAAFPVPLQNLAVTVHGFYWRFLTRGPGYRNALRVFRARNAWTRAQWRRWTANRLKHVLTVSAASVPYYRETWTPTEKRAARAGSLMDIPCVERSAVQVDPWAFVIGRGGIRNGTKAWLANRFRRPPFCFTLHTSGSSGSPMATLWTRDEIVRSLALREVRAAEPAGVSYGMRRAVMTARAYFRADRPGEPVFRYDTAGHRLMLSPYHLQPSRVDDYVQALWRFRPGWLLGYAMSLGLLARMIRAQGRPVPPLRAVITISEPLWPHDRDALEAVFGCRVYEEYGMVENVLYAVECPHGRLHVHPDAGIIEILRPDGTPCEPGEMGEIVATGLLRMFQPLLRYRTGDCATWAADPCECGRPTAVLARVDGRRDDILVTPEGRRVSRIHAIFVHQTRVREAQVIQDAVDHIRIRVVPMGGFNAGDEADIRGQVHRIMGPHVRVTVERVERIERGSSGKFRATVGMAV